MGAGYAPVQATIRYGQRCGTYRAFLQRAMTRSNLHVLTNTVVKKVRRTPIRLLFAETCRTCNWGEIISVVVVLMDNFPTKSNSTPENNHLKLYHL